MRRFLLLPLLLLLAPVTARAGGPVLHEVAGHDALAEGEFEGLSLDAEGTLRAGPVFDSVDLGCASAWCAARDDSGLWIGTGNEAKLLRVVGDDVEAVDVGDGLMVTAVAPLPEGAVAAAVYPGGRIVRVSASGEVQAIATLAVEHVWALAADPRGGLVVATGLPAQLVHVDAFGAVDTLVELEDEHARCLARDEDVWLVGTSPRGLVIEVEDGRARVRHDADAKEIVGLVPLADGGLIVAGNADQAGGSAQTLAGLLNQVVNPPETKPDQAPAGRAALQDGRLIHLEAGGAVTELWSEAKVALLSLAADGAGAIAGIYPGGRLLRVVPGEAPAILADLPEAEASVVLSEDGRRFAGAVTSNPAVLHRRREGSTPARFTAKPLDAEAHAPWGRIAVRGRGVEALQVRHGETSIPDESWSPWRTASGFDGHGGDAAARARFLQIRVGLSGEDAELRSVSVVSAAPNRAPSIQSLDAAPDEGAATWKVTWKAADPDDDALRVSLEANRDGSPLWMPLVEGEILGKPEWSWKTDGLPDGDYRLRLTLDDAADQPPTAARRTTRVTDPFRVDHTPPHVRVKASLTGDRVHVEGEAVDHASGRLTAVRVSVDGGPWVVAAAVDGLMDESREAFEVTLALPGPGPHDVVAQAEDASGNRAAAATVVVVP